MKKLALTILALLVCSGSGVAQTMPKTTLVAIDVRNHSNTCAWVTIYWGRIHTPWVIESDPAGRPQFVNYRSNHTFFVRFTNPTSIPLPAEIKVRAEFTRNQNCSGGNIADNSAENKGIMADRKILERVDISSTLNGPPYGVTTPR